MQETYQTQGSVPGSGRSPGRGHGNLLQYSSLEKPLDRGAWWSTVLGVAQSRPWLKRLNTHAGDTQDYVWDLGVVCIIVQFSEILLCFFWVCPAHAQLGGKLRTCVSSYTVLEGVPFPILCSLGFSPHSLTSEIPFSNSFGQKNGLFSDL